MLDQIRIFMMGLTGPNFLSPLLSTMCAHTHNHMLGILVALDDGAAVSALRLRRQSEWRVQAMACGSFQHSLVKRPAPALRSDPAPMVFYQ